MPSRKDLVLEQRRKRVARMCEGKRMPLRRNRSREETASEREELELRGLTMQRLWGDLRVGNEGDGIGIGIVEKDHVNLKGESLS